MADFIGFVLGIATIPILVGVWAYTGQEIVLWQDHNNKRYSVVKIIEIGGKNG